MEVWGLPRLPAELCQFGFARKGASAPRSRTEVLIPNSAHLIPLRGINGGMGITSPPGELCQFGFARKGASAPRSRTEVLIPNSAHLIPLRGINGGMGIRTPDLLIANETLYQLSYTPNMLISRDLHMTISDQIVLLDYTVRLYQYRRREEKWYRQRCQAQHQPTSSKYSECPLSETS